MSFATIDSLESRRLFSTVSYTNQKLVSDGATIAAREDARLKNPWGLAVGGKGIEVADNGTGVGTMYNGSGDNVVGTARVPGPAGAQGAPTGVAYNGDSTAFRFLSDSKSAQFIFVTENGTIDAWTGSKADKTATVVVDQSASDAVYKGAAIGAFKHKAFLYAANFTGNSIDVFNSTFARSHVSGRFVDPNLPSGYSPFNVTNINNELWVTYAKRANGADDETAGAGLGVVNVFGTDGKLIRRFAAGSKLNAPWGVALAPDNFGAFSGDILIGNFGDGKITAYKPKTGQRKGQLSDQNDEPIVLEGLWGIAFGNGKAGNLTTGLYYGAGTNDEADGLYGRLIDDTDIPYPSGFGRAWHPRSESTADHADKLETLDELISTDM